MMITRKLMRFNGGGRKSSAAGAGGDAPSSSSARIGEEDNVKWEMRPGGMLVQKRCDKNDVVSAPIIHIRVAYGDVRYDLAVNSQATFGEVKKVMTAETGLQAAEQRLIFRGKERDNGDYLDMCGVKDRSKLLLIEDPQSKEMRFIQMRKNAKILTLHRFINNVTLQIDHLSHQVCEIQKSIENEKKVPELQITTLIEMLMAQAVKLDSIHADGDAYALKNLQGERVRKCVEKLDELKMANANVKPVVVTTMWQILDPQLQPNTTWELFD